MRFPWFLVVGLLATGCIADVKLPPEPTVEYLPCSAMDLVDPRTNPPSVLETSSLWGGFWTVGDEWHIGLTDPGAVDWDDKCPEIGDPALVVHDVPHSVNDLDGWNHLIAARMSDTMSVGLTIINGQHVLEVQADDLTQAAEATRGVPLSAWAYGGPLAKPNIDEPVD